MVLDSFENKKTKTKLYMLTIKHYSNNIVYTNCESLHIGKEIALNNELFVYGWSFQKWLKSANIEHLFITFYKDQPIGCCIILNMMDRGCNFGIFIKEKYRRLGIGTKTIQKVKEVYDVEYIAHGCGCSGSLEFFERVFYEKK